MYHLLLNIQKYQHGETQEGLKLMKEAVEAIRIALGSTHPETKYAESLLSEMI